MTDFSDTSALAGCSVVDCAPRPKPERPEETAPARPAVDYMAKDFDSFMRAMLDLLPSRVPRWKDRTEADLGMALIELFAYVGDQLSYYQDRVAGEAYLRTAVQHESVRRLLSLIDYAIHPGLAAVAWLVAEVEAGTPHVYVPPRTRFSTSGGTPVPFESEEGTVLYEELNAVPIASVPDPSTVVLRGILDESRLWGGRRIYVETERTWLTVRALSHGTGTTRVDLASPAGALLPTVVAMSTAGGSNQQIPVPFLEKVLPERRGLLLVLVDGVSFSFRPDFASSTATDQHFAVDESTSPFSIRFGDGIKGLAPAAGLSVEVSYGAVRANTIRVTHGETVEEHSAGTGGADQRYALTRAPVTHTLDEEDEPRSSLTVTVDGEPWTRVEDFVDSAFADPHFVVVQDNDGYAEVVFGDGRTVRVPDAGADVEVLYRVGQGDAGRVAANTITGHAVEHLASISNPEPSGQSVEPQSLEEAKLLGPPAILQARKRAVTEADYADVLLEGVDVGGVLVKPIQALARTEWSGSWHTVVVSVDLADRGPLDLDVRAACEAALRERKLIGYDVRVERARYVPLHVGLVVQVAGEHFAFTVREEVEAAVAGFFAPGRFGFGQSVYLSDLYAVVSAVNGVESLSVSRFKRLGDRFLDEEANGFIGLLGLEIARCDNDPAVPENGVVYVRTCGGKEG